MLVLQEGQHERAGGERSVSVWMAITNLSAKQEVDEKVSVYTTYRCIGIVGGRMRWERMFNMARRVHR